MMRTFVYVFLFSLFFVDVASAQRFGIRMGAHSSNIRLSRGGVSENGDKVMGFQLGIIGERPLGGSFFLNGGSVLSLKGSKLDGNNARVLYMELPINFGLKARMGDANLLVMAGPYYAIGVAGKVGSKKWKFGSRDGELSRFDLGINAGLGLEFGSVQFIGGYGLGLLNVTEVDDIRSRNHVLSLTMNIFIKKQNR